MPEALEKTRRKSEPSRPTGIAGVTRGCNNAYPSTTRPGEGMRHLANESPARFAREPRVRVERDHIADVLGHGGGRQESGVWGATKEPIEFAQLPALAFPPDPAAFAPVPDTPAVQ